MIDEDLAFADLAALRQVLNEGRASSRHLTRFFLERLDRIGRTLNAVVTLDAPGALAAADASDQRRAAGSALGALDGIPFAVKDNIFTAAPLPTLLGVAGPNTPMPSIDAEVVRRLKNAGAVLLGKLALMELLAMLPFDRFDAAATGTCRNPFDIGAWTGDSSTGPAAAVAAGCVPFALATETHGSIVQPAAFCGVVGLRPTHGAVPSEGTFVVLPSLDRVGPIARTPEDVVAVLRVIGDGRIAADRPRRPRIALLLPSEGADTEVKRNLETLAERLAQVAEIVPAELPDLPVSPCFRTVMVEEARVTYAPLIADGTVAQLISAAARDGDYLALPSDRAALAEALRERERIDAAFSSWLRPYDAVLAATNPRVAPPVNVTFSEWFGDEDHEPVTTFGALLGLPALTIPCGFGAHLRPVGAQFVGARGSEGKLAAIASLAASTLPRLRPPLAQNVRTVE